MFKLVFIATFLFHATTSGFDQKSWFDDIDGPNFLRGAEEQIQEDKKLDADNDFKRVTPGEIVTTASSIKEAMICDVAAHPDGINTTLWDANRNEVSMGSLCAPYPTMVKLDRPAGVEFLHPVFYTPSYMVLLHRCMGSCSTPDLMNCTVKRQEEIVLKVWAGVGANLSIKHIKVYNHTQCECGCMTRKSDCDEKNRTYSSDLCSCDCKQDPSNPCNRKQRFDKKTCKCECKNRKLCLGTANHEWNPKICECDCNQRVKTRCTRKGKVLNKMKCECECPPHRPCPQGTKFVKHSCTCVDTSVNTK